MGEFWRLTPLASTRLLAIELRGEIMLRAVAVAAIGVLFAGTAEAGVWTRVAVSPTVEVAYDKGYVNSDHANRYISVIWVQRTTQAAEQGGDYRVSREYVDCGAGRLRTTRSATYVFGAGAGDPVASAPEQAALRPAPAGGADQLLAEAVCGPVKTLTPEDQPLDDAVFARNIRADWPTPDGEASAGKLAPKPSTPARTASAQPDPSEAPTYGSVVLSGEHIHSLAPVGLRAGGEIDASRLSSTCSGFISRAPDYRVDYTAGAFSLNMLTQSSIDTTLVVRDPAGPGAAMTTRAAAATPM
ncbi:MAG: hypothetical protein EBR82_11085 [Caulobacteraceae bacterium]|nr:hypothetical protein [Caulobacteraceae bacterium]